MKFLPDIDIDCADRNLILENLKHIPASICVNDECSKHNVGVYFQNIPHDPITGISNINYKEADERGYFKVDLLNLNVYKSVKDEKHLMKLMNTEPLWEMLLDAEISKDLFQLGGHIDGLATSTILNMYKPQTIMELAICIALIRPRKKHLIGKPWDYIKEHIWEPGDDSLYGYKKAHAVSYAHVIVVQMNLIMESV